MNKLLLFASFFLTVGYAQLTSPDQFMINAGMSIPAAPEQFSDFWNDGFHIGVNSLYTARYPYVGKLSLEYNRFSFDESQLNKKLDMTSGTATVSGAGSTIVRFSTGMNYYFQADPMFEPFVSAGLSLSYLSISEATVTYPYSVKTQGSSYKIYIGGSFSGGVSHSLSKDLDLVLSIDRVMGFKKDKSINTDYFTITIGALWDIDY